MTSNRFGKRCIILGIEECSIYTDINANWQMIYKTEDGKDYSRITIPLETEKERLQTIANCYMEVNPLAIAVYIEIF